MSNYAEEINNARYNYNYHVWPGLYCAKKLYELLDSSTHTELSKSLAVDFLNRLVNNKPITELTGKDDEWKFVHSDDEKEIYQNIRCKSTFKYIYLKDNNVEYYDTNRFKCFDIDDPGIGFSSGIIDKVMNSIMPIEFPYDPNKRQIKVFFKKTLFENGEQLINILFAYIPDTDPWYNRQEVNRYLYYSNGEYNEINKDKYDLLIKSNNSLVIEKSYSNADLFDNAR